MTYGNLSAVINACKSSVNYHDEVLRVRYILHRNRHSCLPLYVVVMPSGHMFVVSEYMPAMTFEDMGANVFGVWRDSDCNWRVCQQ